MSKQQKNSAGEKPASSTRRIDALEVAVADLVEYVGILEAREVEGDDDLDFNRAMMARARLLALSAIYRRGG